MTKLSLQKTARDTKCNMSILDQDQQVTSTEIKSHFLHQQDLGAVTPNARTSRCLHKYNQGKDFIKIQQLIDLTDKPIRLTREEIGWSRVRSNASNCICCCCNNSITLVTTDESYVLDHIPLDHIETGQANSSLQYLALANHEQLAIIDLVESNVCCSAPGSSRLQQRPATNGREQQQPLTQTKLVNLASLGLTMSDVQFWRWIDEFTLTLVTYDTLYTCRIDQPQLSHPAMSALGRSSSQLLALERVCDVHPGFDVGCQITDVHRDASSNLYAITGIHLKHAKQAPPQRTTKVYQTPNTQHRTANGSTTPTTNHLIRSTLLRPSFNSVPDRLSQLANNEHRSLDSVKSENMSALQSLRRVRKISSNALRSSLIKNKVNNNSNNNNNNNKPSQSEKVKASECSQVNSGEVVGLTQIHCCLRDCSQLIQAHAVAFTTTTTPKMKDLSSSTSSLSSSSGRNTNTNPSSDDLEQNTWTTLVAANRVQNKLKIYFIGMATGPDLATSGQNVARTIEFHPSQDDFPTSIVCTHLDQADERTHLALITTKFGQLFVCSLSLSSVLFNVQISHDLVSGAVLEQKSRGLMIICRNGQVLLVRLLEDKMLQLLDETKSLCHVPSQCMLLSTPSDNSFNAHSIDEFNNNKNNTINDSFNTETQQKSPVSTTDSDSIDLGLEVLISTRL